jgi:hypothetical protein
MTTSETTIDRTLHRGTAEEVLALRDPIGGGALRIEYCETAKGSHFRVTGTQSDFIMRMSGRLQKPTWIGVLGTDFITRPPIAEHGAPPNGGPAEPLSNSGVGGGPPSVS